MTDDRPWPERKDDLRAEYEARQKYRVRSLEPRCSVCGSEKLPTLPFCAACRACLTPLECRDLLMAPVGQERYRTLWDAAEAKIRAAGRGGEKPKEADGFLDALAERVRARRYKLAARSEHGQEA